MSLTLRVILALVFAVAGFAKLADRPGSRQALRDFGLPGAVAGPAATLLPLAELAAAGLLLFAGTAVAGAWLAAILLLAFMAGIARSMARGEAPDCHCFGQLHSAPAGPRTLARNGLLAAMAIVIVAVGDPGPGAFAWLGDLDGTQLALVITTSVLLLLIAALARFTLALLKQNGRILQRLDALEGGSDTPVRKPIGNEHGGLAVGTRAPSFELPDLAGDKVSLEALLADRRPLLLLFTDPDCGPCSALMPEIGEWQRAHAGRLTIAVISRGTPAANRAKAEEHGIERLLLQEDREVALAYDGPATPTGILVAADGTLASGAAPGADNIRRLVTQATAAHVIELPAPPLEFPDLDGATIDLAAPSGSKRALLFWNPSCGFCERMLDDLRTWENEARGDVELIVVSRGDVHSNRDQGLRSTIVLDDDFVAGNAFGAGGTPSAVLLDEDGKVVSPVAVGAPAVLELFSASAALASAR
jgi:methylamine dehydrogenase accessory protein MauD